MGPAAALLADGQRLHLQHGPIDLVIGAEGRRDAAFAAARARFQTILAELVGELPLLRRAVGEEPQGVVARRMVAAARLHGARTFVTPMAAVAGAVAEEVLASMLLAGALRRAYVNNGGDIAFHLADGQAFRMAIAGLDGRDLGRVVVQADDPVRGLATSGLGGRSLTMGIAETVSVLAETAALADVAATLIANAVDLPDHPSVRRVPACEVQPDSDLGTRLVVRQVGVLTQDEVASALDRGVRVAAAMRARGEIAAAALFLRGEVRCVGETRLMVPQGKALIDA